MGLTNLSMKCRFVDLRILFVFLLCFRLEGFCQQTDYDTAVIKYILKYNPIAVREMKIYRIPASITLAQGIFESNAGRSKLATEANNHFGIKCHKDWTGETYIQDDETKDECFRKYDNPEESFRDHSWFLTQRERYQPLFSLDIRDYKGWARGLKDAGYATLPNYPEKLIKTIEAYELYKFDIPDYQAVYTDTSKVSRDSLAVVYTAERFKKLSPGPGKHTIYTVNDLKLTIALKGETWEDISGLFHISTRKLCKYNDLKNLNKPVPGQIVYLEKKKKKASLSWYIAQKDETMYMVSQFFGIQLEQLYRLNGLKPGKPIKAGRKLILR
jgi:LysM repeat protein